jgi:PAN domain-containing protein
MRCLFLAAVLALCAVPARAVDGFNLPGSDYANFNAHSVQVCSHTCAADPHCRAYTWVKPGIQGPSGRCWLKHRVPSLVRDNCCDSGSAANFDASLFRAENNTNRPASDYRSFGTASWQTCQNTCGQEQRCSAWTWVRPGVQGPGGNCWLKTGAPRPVADNNCISGVRLQPRSVRID